MAVTINNIKGLSYDGTIELVSAFAHNGFTFDVAGAPTGYYCKIAIGSIEFSCVNTTSNSWAIDMTEMLPSLLGLAPITVTETGLTNDIISTIKVYDNTDTLLKSETETVFLCYGKPKRGVAGGMSLVNTLTKYHNGKYCIYSVGNGVYAILTNQTDEVYRPMSGAEIAWINSEGGWSFWNFRLISETITTKNSNEVAYYALRNSDMVMSSYDMDSETTSEVSFDTVAVDATHYSYLTEIQNSKRVIYNGRVYRVKDCSKTTAAYRQNLKFRLTLETQENA